MFNILSVYHYSQCNAGFIWEMCLKNCSCITSCMFEHDHYTCALYIYPTGEGVQISVVRDTTILTITESEPCHSGKYTLCIENELGKDVMSASVTVEG